MDHFYCKLLMVLVLSVYTNVAQISNLTEMIEPEVQTENVLLEDIKEMVSKLLQDHEHRLNTRMTEFETRIENTLRAIQPCATDIMYPGPREQTEGTNNITEMGGNSNIDSCRDLNGSVITEGNYYHPYFGDPCVFCKCGKSGPVYCGSVMCARPTCEEFDRVPGKCCDYTCRENNDVGTENGGTPNEISEKDTACLDWKNSTIPNGEVYSPNKDDLCFQCTCESGSPVTCFSVSCFRPECDNYLQTEGVCCDFTCLPENNEIPGTPIGASCIDWKNATVPEGEVYSPDKDDICFQCTCESGSPVTCFSVSCFRPECDNYVQTEGVCCEFTCIPENNEIPGVPTETTCIDWKNSTIPEGEVYSPNKDDICFQCTCESGSPVICFSVNCFQPECDNYVQTEGVCCEFTCLPENNEIPGAPAERTCLDFKNATIPEGGVYSPNKDDLCFQCTCESGSPVTCFSVSCFRPECDNYVQTEGVCCEFTCIPDNELPGAQTERTCKDWNNITIDEGEIYSPDQGDMCYKCTCQGGKPVQCSSVSCFRPECEFYKQIDGVCCEFICLPDPEINEIQQDAKVYEEDTCADWNGNSISDGETYLPDEHDPCLNCTCEGGSPIKCFTVQCHPPRCEYYEQTKGVCCDFTCLPEQSHKNVVPPAGSCPDLNGTIIDEGHTYRPYKDDPCIFCTCIDGNPVICGSEQCDKPQCSEYTQILGTCCDYVCNDQGIGQLDRPITLDAVTDELYFCGESDCRLEYHGPNVDNRIRTNISIDIRTIVEDGMIFYSKSSENSTRYEMLWLSEGRIIYSFNLGRGPVYVSSTGGYNDDQWHTIKTYRYKAEGTLFVDGDEVGTVVSPMENVDLNNHDIYYVGALPNGGISTADSHVIIQSFHGCLRKFKSSGDGFGSPTVAMNTEPCFNLP